MVHLYICWQFCPKWLWWKRFCRTFREKQKTESVTAEATETHRQESSPTTCIPTFPHFLRVPDYRCSHECVLCPSCERLCLINAMIFRAYRKLSAPPPFCLRRLLGTVQYLYSQIFFLKDRRQHLRDKNYLFQHCLHQSHVG